MICLTGMFVVAVTDSGLREWSRIRLMLTWLFTHALRKSHLQQHQWFLSWQRKSIRTLFAQALLMLQRVSTSATSLLLMSHSSTPSLRRTWRKFLISLSLDVQQEILQTSRIVSQSVRCTSRLSMSLMKCMYLSSRMSLTLRRLHLQMMYLHSHHTHSSHSFVQ